MFLFFFLIATFHLYERQIFPSEVMLVYIILCILDTGDTLLWVLLLWCSYYQSPLCSLSLSECLSSVGLVLALTFVCLVSLYFTDLVFVFLLQIYFICYQTDFPAPSILPWMVWAFWLHTHIHMYKHITSSGSVCQFGTI